MHKKPYTLNGLTVVEFLASDFKLAWHDKPKLTAKHDVCFNVGFFARYPENGKWFTLPVANICMDADGLTDLPKKYILEWTQNKGLTNGKIKMSCNENCNLNGANKFYNKKVSTLIIDSKNKVSFTECNSLPSDCKYAVSGMPVIRDGVDVSWTKFVLPQGWGTDTIRATYRNFIGNKGDKMYLISGTSTTANHISSSETYNKVKSLELSNLLAFDGGGSFMSKIGETILKPTENRQVNNIGIIL